jgi:hypothetical protein
MATQVMLVLLAALACTANGREFLGAKRKIDSAAAKAELNGLLNEVLGHGHGFAESRLKKIHTVLDPMFKALPKNRQGYVSAPVMRYAIRRYFSQSHGWMVKGFNAYEDQTNTSEQEILQSKLPGYVRSVLEDRFADQGFSLDAVVALAATVERMAFDEVSRGVELAFWLNDIDRYQAVSREQLQEIITSFLVVEVLEGTENKEKHIKEKNRIYRRYPHWGTTILFLQDTIGSDVFQRQGSLNPFTDREVFSFEDAARISEHISFQFGKWSEHECQQMKDMLVGMDVYGTGRVKLSDFYGGWAKDGAWQFLEPSEQLRQAGALDESSTWIGPQVMIPNYIYAMSNCITSQPYYQICCINECDRVFQQLESRIVAPRATASEVIGALESGVYAPVNISALDRDRLHQIADVNHGQVPMYGRLFARWLHFVYPLECAYPHADGVVKPMTQREWKEMVGAKEESVTDDEIIQHLGSDFARRAPSPDAGASMWSLDESLLDDATSSDFAASSIRTLLRILVQIGMLVGFVSLLMPLMPLITALMRFDAKGKKTIEYDV